MSIFSLQNVFAVIDLYGMVESVSVISSGSMVTDSTTTTPSVESETGHQVARVSTGLVRAFIFQLPKNSIKYFYS